MRAWPVRWACLAGALALVALAYLPGLRGPFVFDDFPNILNNPAMALTELTPQTLRTAALSNRSGPLGRPVAALSFGLDHYRAGGFYPLAFKLTNLAIHLLNVLLVYAIAVRLARRLGAGEGAVAVGVFCAALWGLHPLQLTSVLYVVQRMTSLAGTFTLAAVLCWIEARGRWGQRPATGWLLACGGLFVLGVFTKENAILLPLYLAVIEWCLWRPAAVDDPGRRMANRFFALTLLAPLLLGLALLAVKPDLLLDGYASRPFTLGERLLTEARVLWFYVGLIALPTPARLGLYHDDIAISTGLLDPWTTLLALDGWAIVLGAAFLLRRRAPAFTFGVLWFLAGHALESTVVPLEIAHEHRNYLPSLGVLFAAVGCLAAVARRSGQQRVYAGLGLAATVVFGFCTFGQAAVWASDETIIEALHRHHPRSPSAQQMMGELMFKRYGQPAQAAAHYRRAAELAPWEAGYAIRALWARHAAGELGPTETEVQAIAKTLRERPVPPTTLIALQNLSDCARTDAPVCRRMLSALLPWLAAAQENPRLGDVGRQQVWMNYAQVCLETDRYGEGLAWVRLVQQRSGQAVYRLMEANFLMLQGHLDAAEAVLVDVARQPALTPTDREHGAVLHDAIQQRRAAQSPATDGPG
ncbi:MAG: pilus assembly protein PilF [Pseudomonadota bacterium]